MEEKINYLLQQCKGINPRAKTRLSIVANYDVLYHAMIDDGISKLVAHTWTMLGLARLHGRIKVERILAKFV